MYRGERTVYECLGACSLSGALGGWLFLNQEYLLDGKKAGNDFFSDKIERFVQ